MKRKIVTCIPIVCAFLSAGAQSPDNWLSLGGDLNRWTWSKSVRPFTPFSLYLNLHGPAQDTAGLHFELDVPHGFAVVSHGVYGEALQTTPYQGSIDTEFDCKPIHDIIVLYEIRMMYFLGPIAPSDVQVCLKSEDESSRPEILPCNADTWVCPSLVGLTSVGTPYGCVTINSSSCCPINSSIFINAQTCDGQVVISTYAQSWGMVKSRF